MHAFDIVGDPVRRRIFEPIGKTAASGARDLNCSRKAE